MPQTETLGRRPSTLGAVQLHRLALVLMVALLLCSRGAWGVSLLEKFKDHLAAEGDAEEGGDTEGEGVEEEYLDEGEYDDDLSDLFVPPEFFEPTGRSHDVEDGMGADYDPGGMASADADNSDQSEGWDDWGDPEELDELDDFLWTEHLEAFDGKAGSSVADEHWQGDSGGKAESAIEGSVVAIVDWMKQYPPHQDYVPFKVDLGTTSDPARHALRLLAGQAIPKEGVVMAVHTSLTAPADSFTGLQVPYEGADWAVLLAAWLLRERASGEESEWLPYLRLLPQREPLPLLWAEEQVELLELPAAIFKVKLLKEEVESKYRKCNAAAIAYATLEDFRDAVSVVMSRSIAAAEDARQSWSEEAVKDDGHGSAVRHFLVPLGELAERAADAQARWQVLTREEQDFVSLVAESDIVAGARITVPFPAQDSQELLLSLGRFPPINVHDRFDVFGPPSQLVNYFSDNFLQDAVRSGEDAALPLSEQPWNLSRSLAKALKLAAAHEEGENRSALDIVTDRFKERARTVVDAAVLAAAPQKPLGEEPMVLGHDGAIDPRLWAAYAGCVAVLDHLDGSAGTRIRVDIIALLATALEVEDNNLTCSGLLHHAEQNFPGAQRDELQSAVTSVQVASGYIRELASVWYGSFKAGLEEDEEKLATAQQCTCSVNAASGEGGEAECGRSCRGSKMSPEEDAALRFRVNRKRLLRSTMARIDRICPRDVYWSHN